MTFTNETDLTLDKVLLTDHDKSYLNADIRHVDRNFMYKNFKENIYDKRLTQYNTRSSRFDSIEYVISVLDIKCNDNLFKYYEYEVDNILCHRCGSHFYILNKSHDHSLCDNCTDKLNRYRISI